MEGDESILKQIGSAIKSRREKLGMSQERLAERSGVDRSFICGVERGINNVSIVTLCEILHAMGDSFFHFMKCISQDNKNK